MSDQSIQGAADSNDVSELLSCAYATVNDGSFATLADVGVVKPVAIFTVQSDIVAGGERQILNPLSVTLLSLCHAITSLLFTETPEGPEVPKYFHVPTVM
jgi:hypothetical protein